MKAQFKTSSKVLQMLKSPRVIDDQWQVEEQVFLVNLGKTASTMSKTKCKRFILCKPLHSSWR